MTIAVNNAGDVLTLSDNGAWQPATIAHNPDTGARLVLDGGAWKPAPSPQQSDAAPKQDAPTTFTEYGPDATTPATGTPGQDAIGPASGRIINAATDAYDKTPSILGQPTQDFLDQSPIGRQLINPAMKIAGVVPAAAHAGMAALSQAAMEVFGEKGGRDALALLSTLPMAPETAQAMALLKTTSPKGIPVAAAAETPAANPRFVSETMMPPDTVGLTPLHRALDLIRHDDMENGVAASDRGASNQGSTPADVMRAPDLDSAIAAANDASRTTAAPYVPVTVSEVATRDGVGANEAYRRMVAENAARQGPVAPSPAPVAPEPALAEPQSLGAAASRDMTPPDQIALSTDDMKANRRRAEMDELLAPPQPKDHTVYVNGSFPTLAERSGDPEISQTENMLRQRNAGAFIGEGKILTENNKARVAEFDNQTVPDPTLNTMRKARADQWVAASNDILPSAKPADLTPAWDWVSGELDNPKIQENDAVRNVLEDFRDRLVDDGGNLKTDPASVWGMHDNLQNLLAKAKDPLNMTGAEKFAESQILTAKGLVDQAMNVATDNKFQSALDNYAEASKPINSGVLLNNFRSKLTNLGGELQPANFHRFVLGLAKERGDPGIDPAMDISDDTMRSLLNIDADLKRAGLIKLGGAAGSPTNLLGALAQSAGVDAAHSVLGAVPGVGTVLKAGADFMAKRRLDALTAHHLAPPSGGYVYPQDAGP